MALNPWFAVVIWGVVIIVLTGPMLTLPFFWSEESVILSATCPSSQARSLKGKEDIG